FAGSRALQGPAVRGGGRSAGVRGRGPSGPTSAVVTHAVGRRSRVLYGCSRRRRARARLRVGGGSRDRRRGDVGPVARGTADHPVAGIERARLDGRRRRRRRRGLRVAGAAARRRKASGRGQRERQRWLGPLSTFTSGTGTGITLGRARGGKNGLDGSGL